MIKAITLLHRWAGGIIGLLLAGLGLSGAILAFKDYWIAAPGSDLVRTQTVEELSLVVGELLNGSRPAPDAVLFASESFGLHRTYVGENSGAYVNQFGDPVVVWHSVWDRPEHWLFDFHHHLFMGDAGEVVTGIAGLIGMAFILTGLVLWSRTRRTFQFRIWPRRFTKSAIIRHHRDLGLIVSPVLFLVCLTGAMMTLKPVASFVLSPLSASDEMIAAAKPPVIKGDILSDRLDWMSIFSVAKSRFPDAEIRVLGLPRKPGDLIALRLKQPAEWLPNGRTTLWFAPENGQLIEARDAFRLPAGSQLFNKAYPLHSGKVGGLWWTILIALCGVALTLLGALATWSFWFGKTASQPLRPVHTIPILRT